MHGLTGVLLAACVLPTNTAHAYRTYADDPEVGEPARFGVDAIEWEISAPPLSRDRAEAIELSASRAFSAWTSLPCGGASATLGAADAPPGASGDGRNTLTFVDSDWVARGLPAGHPATADVQLTRVEGVWVISEADIFVDLSGWGWVELGDTRDALSLEAVLAHEIGHLWGLLHNCEADDPAAPRCADDPAFASALLFPEYGSARLPTADDAAGFCFLYPRDPAAECESCRGDEECVEGRCVAACTGTDCSEPCEADADCAGGACAIAGPVARVCVGAGDRGAACEVGADCTSGRCLRSRHAEQPYCTETCVTDESCGLDERCAQVAGMQVCAPRLPPQSCSASHAKPGSPWGTVLALVVVVGAIGRRRSRRWERVS